MAADDRSELQGLPPLMLERLSALLDWDRESFDEHFATLAHIAIQLGTPEDVARAAETLVCSDSEDMRALGFDLLAAAITSADLELVTTLVRLSGLPQAAGGDDLRWSVAHALACTDDARAIDPLLSFVSDPDGDVRWQVAVGLNMNAQESTAAIEALITLTDDVEPNIRDWATFALAQSRCDSPAIQTAFL